QRLLVGGTEVMNARSERATEIAAVAFFLRGPNNPKAWSFGKGTRGGRDHRVSGPHYSEDSHADAVARSPAGNPDPVPRPGWAGLLGRRRAGLRPGEEGEAPPHSRRPQGVEGSPQRAEGC